MYRHPAGRLGIDTPVNAAACTDRDMGACTTVDTAGRASIRKAIYEAMERVSSMLGCVAVHMAIEKAMYKSMKKVRRTATHTAYRRSM